MWWHRPSVYLAFVITCALIGPAPSTMAASVSAGKVLGACKRTKGCYTTTTGNGAIWGCSAHACFVCYKGKCTPQPAPDVRANPPKTGPGGGNSAGTTTTAASGSATGQKNEHPITNVHQPVVLQHSGSSHSGGSKH